MNVMHPSLSGPFFVEREQERVETGAYADFKRLT